jgi:predicted amidophosphoribosyltransferase
LLDLSQLSTQPSGFGNCGSCLYRDSGSAAICFACAAQTVEHVSDNRCVICDQRLTEDTSCTNHWCRQADDVRGFGVVFAIAMRTGALEDAINRYKFGDKYGWASIFGRVVVGYLDEHSKIFEQYGLIVASPTYLGPGARRTFDHIGSILAAAKVEDVRGWPFDDVSNPAIVKTAETPSMTSMATVYERRNMAATELRAALSVPDPARVRDRAILVLDDVFTDGTTLREIAFALKNAGATRVDGLALSRQPWRT